MAKKKYYAVKIGNKPGIYETWAECELQVKGISGAVYKSFATMEEAERSRKSIFENYFNFFKNMYNRSHGKEYYYPIF